LKNSSGSQHIDHQAALEWHAGPIHELDVALVEQEDAALCIEHASPCDMFVMAESSSIFCE
jgi:hypothetical protein